MAVCAAVLVPIWCSGDEPSPDNASSPPVIPAGRVWCLKEFSSIAGVMVDEYRGCYADIGKAAEVCAAVKSSCYLVALEIGQ